MTYKTLIMAATITMAAGLAGCATQIQNHGQVIKEDQIETLKVGISTKRDVARTLGTPSTAATFADDRWYYISEQVVVKPMDRRTLTDRQIVIVDFGKAGKVSAITYKGKEDGRFVNTSSKTTPTQGRKLGFFEQMFNNLGSGF